ncbi:hypothetical protein CVT24_009601 [Panaeolus cyanescens]|uniref:DUF6532 domain-containing protein n=1 Tax=Panaeolus cyanescens TaxID=181874 RepID=A0A409WEZ2_9AGAR|nr:hypothetical protein CVT24_009601 [Panaeolus cyanescens]
MDAASDLSDSVANRNRITDEQKRRRKLNMTVQRQAEEEALINSTGRIPRQAKTNANKNAVWMKAQGKKRRASRSPSPSGNVKVLGDSDRHNVPQKETHSSGNKTKAKKAKPNANYSDDEEPIASEEDDELDSSDFSDNNDQLDSDEESEEDMSDEELARRKLDEMPLQVTKSVENLFDDDEDVEYITSKKRTDTRTLPQSVDTEESESNSNISVGVKRKAKTLKRDEQWDAERPTKVVATPKPVNNGPTLKAPCRPKKATSTIPSASDASSPSIRVAGKKVVMGSPDGDDDGDDDPDDTTAVFVPDADWPEETRIRPGKLAHQNAFIVNLVHQAIESVEEDLVLKDAWVELHKTNEYRFNVVMRSIDDLADEDPAYQVIRRRVALDERYVKTLGHWFMNRLALRRNAMRFQASADSIQIFRLGKGPGCADRVKALLLNEGYVFPGSWGKDDDGKPLWIVTEKDTYSQIYHNQAIIDCISMSFFANGSSFGYRFREEYKTSLPDLPAYPEPEITIPIVALAATAVYAAIWELRDGIHPTKKMSALNARKDRFSGEMFRSVYLAHVGDLTELKTRAKISYHKIMASIYSKVTVNDPMGSSAHHGERRRGPLAGVDFSAVFEN